MTKPDAIPTDDCETLLREALANAPRPLLWVVDEHIAQPSRWLKSSASGMSGNDVTIISNRYDCYLDATQAGITAHFSDMDFSAWRGHFKSVVYRISKEKALVHHIINDCRATLVDDGVLILVGGKQEGIRTYIEKAEPCYGRIIAQENGHHSTRMAQLQRTAGAPLCERLEDKDYPKLRLIAEEAGLQFYSKPGQFGWEKTDLGSQLLVAQFDQFFATSAPGNALDLGCGYGYLALHLSRYKPESLLATDNNAAALASCQFNLEHNGVTQGRTLADDCGRQISGRFDTIVCNPPFHQGFSTSSEITDRFLEQTRRLMKRNGQALFVVNQFIPLEDRAASLFKKVDCFARVKGFKLIRLAQPHWR